jgi:hypothetical protein
MERPGMELRRPICFWVAVTLSSAVGMAMWLGLTWLAIIMF